jgi:DNA polymerase
VDPGALVLPGAPPAARPPALDGSGETLAAIRADLGDCTRCKLCAGRKNIVFGTGNPTAPLLFVGEGPGAEEDVQGEPFVGAAGQLLNRMIAAMGFARQDVYIANVVKCRPPGNRNPEPDEIAVCSPFLLRQVGSVRPKVIVTLGKFAAQTLLATEAPVGTLRGRLHPFVVAGESISLMPTYHPAYLLRTPSMKKVVWEDLQVVMAELAKLGVQAPSPPGP